MRLYSFDANGNRTSQTSRTPATTCPTTGGTTITSAYDAADRPTTGGNGTGSYSYDLLSRQTSLPAGDTPTPAGGAITIEYDHSDTARSISQGGTTQTFTLDAAGRRWTQTTTSGSETSTLQRHYTDDGDNPTWTLDSRNNTDTTTVYAELASGNLGLTITRIGNGTPTAELAIPGLRGDIHTTIAIPAGAETHDGTAIQPDTVTVWNDYDEYGQPKQPRTTTPGGTTGIGYGWLGQHQRATIDNGLMLMGARIYNPSTALFTSLDPQHNGGDTTYGYPNDPINKTDITGEFWGAVGNFIRNNWVDIAMTAVSFIPVVGVVGWAYRAYRLVRIVRGAMKGVRATQAMKNGVRATRATSWLAGRMHTGRRATTQLARNGAKWRTHRNGIYHWRSPVKKGPRYSSNLEVHQRGHHLHRNLHIIHRKPSRWARWI